MSLTIFSELPIAIFTNMSVTPKTLNIFSANISKSTVIGTSRANNSMSDTIKFQEGMYATNQKIPLYAPPTLQSKRVGHEDV